MLEQIGPAPSNNCVINRQNLSQQTFSGMKQVAIKCDANKNLYVFNYQFKFIKLINPEGNCHVLFAHSHAHTLTPRRSY